MIRNFQPRLYQETILATASRANSLVVLPTGLGKTNVFLMLSAQRLSQYPNSKILFIGPTRPLIDQYKAVFERNFDIDEKKLITLTGMISPEKRQHLWKDGTIFFSTPQGLENDILSKRINLEEVSLLGIDEAHRAVGDYAYVFIAKRYHEIARYERILALTASPGNDVETIREVCQNLFIEKIEVRTEEDPDVAPYVQEMDVEWVKVDLPEEFKIIKAHLDKSVRSKVEELRALGVVGRGSFQSMSKKELLGLQLSLQSQMMQGQKDMSVLKGISKVAEIMKVSHAQELLESQGIAALESYFRKLKGQAETTKVKAVKNLMLDPEFKSARYLTRQLFEAKIEHPKVRRLLGIAKDTLEKNKDAKLMVFTQYRDSAQMLRDELRAAKMTTELFVGQMKKGETGMSQKEQKAMLDRFRAGEFSVLVSTSIGEEGLDVPSVELVVFYEPVPSAIRSIQRRGRTGRNEKGRAIVLMAAGTRDEAYRWSAHHKEKLMHRTLRELTSKIGPLQASPKLTDFVEKDPKVRILVDFREKSSGIPKVLLDLRVDVEMRQLAVGDYVCSPRVVVELKTVEDFVDSILDGRLLFQLKDLKARCERPVVMIVGESDIYSVRNVHPNAIQGMLATIAVSYGIPLLKAKNDKEAAGILLAIAKREQEGGITDFSGHSEKRASSLKDMQEYIISSLPGVGAQLARPLLRKFGSVKGVINAPQDALQEVEKIGEKKSEDIRKVLDSEYKE